MEVLVFYILPFLIVLGVYLLLKRTVDDKTKAIQREQAEAGLTEPASLHPVIDPAQCIGCALCIKACPEEDVLGILNGKAVLAAPTNCIGHGACRTACPVNAITLVFGTEKRGVDIPFVQPNFETNVPGIFIAGELGGMGLIRNAIEQGSQAIESIQAKVKERGKIQGVRDVVIIGAGPAGFSASLGAIERKMDFVTLEQEAFGGTVSHYPRGKIVMTRPAYLPIIGEVRFREVTKEKLLHFWNETAAKTGLRIEFCEHVKSISRREDRFVVETEKGSHETQTVLLAIGRRGTPRKLGVPGEEMNKVVYRMTDAEQYRGRHVLVVGGGDVALEAAGSLAAQPGTTVTLSYRGDAFGRAKTKNRVAVEAALKEKRLSVLLNSNVKAIRETEVDLEQAGKPLTLPNDAVIVCAGGILPTEFLKSIGIRIETKHGTA